MYDCSKSPSRSPGFSACLYFVGKAVILLLLLLVGTVFFLFPCQDRKTTDPFVRSFLEIDGSIFLRKLDIVAELLCEFLL